MKNFIYPILILTLIFSACKSEGKKNKVAQVETTGLSGKKVCSFVVGEGSPNSGSYVVTASEENAIAFDDTENEQFVIEINGDNNIDIMLIIEEPVVGKHVFSMEMQVAIDIVNSDESDSISFDNYVEEGGGYIEIDRIDTIGGKVSGSFSGNFNDSSMGEQTPIKINGEFSVKRT